MSSILKPISVVLKEARTNKGISLEEVYKATKIHPNILRSLEDGTTLQLPDVYIKSYSKIYAKYLGISAADLEQYFRPVSSKEEKKDRRTVSDIFLKTKKEKIKNFASAAYQLPPGLFLWIRLHLKKIFSIILVVFIIVTMVWFTNNSRNKNRNKASAASTREQPSQKQKENPAAKTTAPKHVAVKKEDAPKVPAPLPPVSDILRLTIFAQNDVWIQVTQDGLVVFKGTLKKLSSETWQAKESFELRSNNASALQLELNGKILAPLGRKGQPLRKVAITKEGLKVE